VPHTPPKFAVGDRVIVDPQVSAKYAGIVWTVEKIMPVNVLLQRVGGGKGLRIPPAALLPAPAAGSITFTPVTAYRPPLPVGAVVTVSSPLWKGGDGLHVVLADNDDTLRLVLLGGNNNRYWPKVPAAWVTPVDTTALLAAVAGLKQAA
jgi:hypothetical protein